MIKRVTTQYSQINGDPDFFVNASAEALNEFYENATPESLQRQHLMINPQLFLDILLLEIRRETIIFSSRLKKERMAKEDLTLQEIEILLMKIPLMN